MAVAALAGAMVLGGCRVQAPDQLPADEIRAGVRSIGSLDPLVSATAASGVPETLVASQILETLIGHDPVTLDPVPRLASSWSVSDDARTFTFQIREGVRFHDESRLTSADVVYTLNRLARAACEPAGSPAAAAPSGLLSVVAGYEEAAVGCSAQHLSGVTAAGERTVMVALTRPFADFVSVLGHPAAAIVPAGAAADPLVFGIAPVGTGPYQVQRAWDGETMRLERFDDYWGPLAVVGSLTFIGYEGDAQAYQALLEGDVHYAAVPPARVRQARRSFGSDGFVAVPGLSFLGFNLSSGRVAAQDAREAVSRMIDRESLASGVFEATRDPAAGLVAPPLSGVGAPGCGDACRYDPNARAGVDGLREELVLGVPSVGAGPSAGQAIAAMLREAGLRVRIHERDFREHLEGVRAGDVDMFVMGWIPEYPAVDGVLWPLFHSTAQDNLTGLADPELDRLLEQARRTVDPTLRHGVLQDAERRILDGLSVAPLLWHRSSVAFDPAVTTAGGTPLVAATGLTDFSTLTFGGQR